MLSATLYISACSMRNRTRRWFRRLREPRYALGLVAALAYLYVTVFARLRVARSAGRRRGTVPGVLSALPGIVPLVAAASLLVAAAGSWLVPASGRLLDFSAAEVQFLFPAPVHRRQLIVHRLLRSQVGLLFAATIPALAFSLPVGSGILAVRTAVGVWILLLVARVYFSAMALARANLTSSDLRFRRLARLPLAVVLVAILTVANAVVREYWRQPFLRVDDATTRLTAILSTGPARVVLWPFMALVQPFFATDWAEWGLAISRGVLVFMTTTAWLMASDALFQSGAAEVVERRDAEPRQGKVSYVVRRSAWTLSPTGRPEVAFFWKTTMQIFRVVDRRIIARFSVVVVALTALVVASGSARGVAGAAGLFAGASALYTALLAPQILRLDLRQDLQHLDLLKTWPVRAAAIVRGEIGGPATALSVVAWALIGLALLFSTAAFPGQSVAWRVAIASASVFLAPALIFGQYTIHNTVALLFPAWIPLGSGRPRGLDAMGQRLLTLGGTWLALALMLLPGAAISAVMWFVLYPLVGPLVLVVAGAISAAAIGIEILVMTEALGPAYERLDLLSIERPD